MSVKPKQEIRREAADSAVTAEAKQQPIVVIWKWNQSFVLADPYQQRPRPPTL